MFIKQCIRRAKFYTKTAKFSLVFAGVCLFLLAIHVMNSGSSLNLTVSVQPYVNFSSLLDANYSCPNLSKLDQSNRIKNEKIAIIVALSSQGSYDDNLLALNSIHCYALHFGYHVEMINMTAENVLISEICNQSDVFFKRHCAVTNWMEQNKDNFEIILYIDADMGVINPCHTIQEYIDEKSVQITFYDRYYDHEIAAGSYLAKNTKYSRDFLKFWADYFYHLPHSFHGTDNGALHQVFMERHFSEVDEQFQCYQLWNTSRNYDDLFRYQICTRFALGNGTYFCDGQVKIVRKGTWGWVRDGWLTGTKFSPNDFMFHGWKKGKLGGEWIWPFENAKFDLKACGPNMPLSNFAFNPTLSRSEEEIMGLLLMKKDQVHQTYLNVLKKLRKI